MLLHLKSQQPLWKEIHTERSFSSIYFWKSIWMQKMGKKQLFLSLPGAVVLKKSQSLPSTFLRYTNIIKAIYIKCYVCVSVWRLSMGGWKKKQDWGPRKKSAWGWSSWWLKRQEEATMSSLTKGGRGNHPTATTKTNNREAIAWQSWGLLPSDSHSKHSQKKYLQREHIKNRTLLCEERTGKGG